MGGNRGWRGGSQLGSYETSQLDRSFHPAPMANRHNCVSVFFCASKKRMGFQTHFCGWTDLFLCTKNTFICLCFAGAVYEHSLDFSVSTQDAHARSALHVEQSPYDVTSCSVCSRPFSTRSTAWLWGFVRCACCIIRFISTFGSKQHEANNTYRNIAIPGADETRSHDAHSTRILGASVATWRRCC
jgi:hypothetical protein